MPQPRLCCDAFAIMCSIVLVSHVPLLRNRCLRTVEAQYQNQLTKSNFNQPPKLAEEQTASYFSQVSDDTYPATKKLPDPLATAANPNPALDSNQIHLLRMSSLDQCDPAIGAAIVSLRNNGNYLTGYDIVVRRRQTNVRLGQSMRKAYQILFDSLNDPYSYLFIFGPDFVIEALSTDEAAPLFNVVTVSAIISSTQFSSSIRFPTTYRIGPKDQDYNQVTVLLLKQQLQATNIGIVYLDDQYAIDRQTELFSRATSNNMVVQYQIIFEPNGTAANLQTAANTYAAYSTVHYNIVVDYGLYLGALACYALKQSDPDNVVNEESNAYIVAGPQVQSNFWFPGGYNPCSEQEMYHAFVGTFVVTGYVMPDGDPDEAKRFDQFQPGQTQLENLFSQMSQKIYPNYNNYNNSQFMNISTPPIPMIGTYTHYMYDTVLSVLLALDKTQKNIASGQLTFDSSYVDQSNPPVLFNPTKTFTGTIADGRVPASSEAHAVAQDLLNSMSATDFYGSTGRVTFDANNDRIADMSIQQLQRTDPSSYKLSKVTVGRYIVSLQKLYMEDGDPVYNYHKVVWGTADGKPPSEDITPEQKRAKAAAYGGGFGGAGAILLGLLGWYIYRQVMLRRELHDASWLIPWNDVKLVKTGDMKRASEGSMGSIGTRAEKRSTQMSVGTAGTKGSKSKVSGSMGEFSQSLFEAHYASVLQGTEKVWLKEFPHPARVVAQSPPFVLNQAFPSARVLMRISNENLTRFIGITLPTLDESSSAYVMFRFMAKNSLAFIVGNNNVELNEDFKSSLLRDIVAGISQLQATPIGSHGFLHANNVVVDSRFTASLTDYAIPFAHEDGDFTPLTIQMVHNLEDNILMKMFYRGPELLRGGMPPHGTKKGDIYSLGILFAQTWTRTPPYKLPADENDKSTPAVRSQLFDIILGVSPLQRPDLGTMTNEPMKAVIREMWLEDPNLRPDIVSIMKTLKKMPGFFRGSILDNLIKRLEAYAENLEKSVAVKTLELNEEKFRTEQLLFQILPRTVADDLKMGRPVVPEAFDCVSIYYSDIVGFTTICSVSTPLQVVGLLNSLYVLFDNTINLFDAYKVETIGDAYIVVSGLPERNGDMHPCEIARLSLSLTTAVMNFKMPHLPNRPLQMRVGMHSGSTVAGVVGLLMPRYCLFGDTVLRAGKMESTSEPDRVQCSGASHDLLEKNFPGLFEFEERGEMEVFGKPLIAYFVLSTTMPLHVLAAGAPTVDVRNYSTRQSFM